MSCYVVGSIHLQIVKPNLAEQVHHEVSWRNSTQQSLSLIRCLSSTEQPSNLGNLFQTDNKIVCDEESVGMTAMNSHFQYL